MQLRSATCAMLMLALAGCDNNVTKEEARALIEKRVRAKDPNAYCPLLILDMKKWESDTPQKYAATTDGNVGPANECVEALRGHPNLILENFTAGRFAQTLITPTEPAYVSTRKKLVVPCGKWTIREIASVVTEDRRATVKYTYTKDADAQQVTWLAKCKPIVPEEGPHEATATFVKTDDGKWVRE